MAELTGPKRKSCEYHKTCDLQLVTNDLNMTGNHFPPDFQHIKRRVHRSMSIEEKKSQFVTSVYDSITKQLQHLDVKTSILLSWNGIMALLLGKELMPIIMAQALNWATIFISACMLISLLTSGALAILVLKPRRGALEKARSAGLLWTGDILRLGGNKMERIENYQKTLNEMVDVNTICDQYSRSIVLLAEIHESKNKWFSRGLMTTVVSFLLLILLVAVMGITLSID